MNYVDTSVVLAYLLGKVRQPRPCPANVPRYLPSLRIDGGC